ncbi:MAG: hypothetical protein IPO88_26025 [Nannocystis sp.]|uniref:hypothetical protein n=1 Tax=Nannocystis sp. TaxID=1962667 RepID=UPI002426FCBD|nr:hypothetical protein [Nannocystis sp.]MBK9756894.1 hypothetical protein [Nannocystis sp.]
MRAFFSPLLGVSLLLTASACGKGDPIQELCELALSCDCAPPPFVDMDACVTEFNNEIEQYKMLATASGLTYDQSCVDRGTAIFTDKVECGLDFPDITECSFCAIIHGSQPEGAACVDQENFSDCAKDLQCADGVCVDPCKRLSGGAVCAIDTGGDIQGIGICADGLYCDYGDTLTCIPLIAEGGACPGFTGCAEGLTCDANVCKATPGEGESCTVECKEGLSCDGGVCKPPPGEGEPCTFDCKENFVCDAMVCKAAPGAGEPCINFTCDANSECDDNTSQCVARQPLVCDINP